MNKCSKGKALFIISDILLLISYLLLTGLMITLAIIRLNINKNFDYLQFSSKILTIKNLINLNHNSKIFYSFSSANNIIGLSTNYNNLLKLVRENGCAENYKPCGILDTIGNILCIDEEYDCPINEMIVDLSSKKNKYLALNYEMGELSNSLYNYRLYYTNRNINGNSSIILIKTEDDEEKPKFITYDSLIIDTDVMEEVFGKLKLNENNNSYYNSDDVDLLLRIGLKLINLEALADLSKAFANDIAEQNKKNVQKFKEYIMENYINTKENNDIYYNHIGDNFYVKNYIGFKSKEDINKFMNFDFNIYKKIFPNRLSAILAACSSFMLFLIISILTSISPYVQKNDKAFYLTVNFSSMHFIISLGFLIYSSVIYIQVYKSNTIKILKTIQSDELINKFINEFISQFEKTKLILSTIAILSSSFLLNLVGLIMLCMSRRDIDSDDYDISF